MLYIKIQELPWRICQKSLLFNVVEPIQWLFSTLAYLVKFYMLIFLLEDVQAEIDYLFLDSLVESFTLWLSGGIVFYCSSKLWSFVWFICSSRLCCVLRHSEIEMNWNGYARLFSLISWYSWFAVCVSVWEREVSFNIWMSYFSASCTAWYIFSWNGLFHKNYMNKVRNKMTVFPVPTQGSREKLLNAFPSQTELLCQCQV